jgi:bifunctional UDP-N-acetylglucosamine pyrophosphorylase/glucosamine-1-phosphate N-acetyltransferase
LEAVEALEASAIMLSNMQAVILAAGRGTRMNHLTKDMPKPMLNIGRMNLIEWKIEALPEEIDEVVLVIGYLGEQIKKHFGNNFAGKKIIYIEQKKLNGTGGALFLAKSLLKDKFLVMNGDDVYSKEDANRMIENGWSILAKKADGKVRGAKIVVSGSQTIKEIIENVELKTGDWNNAGMYVLGREIFNYPLVKIQNGEFGLPQTIALAAKDIPVRIMPAKRWLQVTCPEDIPKVEKLLA